MMMHTWSVLFARRFEAEQLKKDGMKRACGRHA